MSESAPPRVYVVHEPLRKVTDPATGEVRWERMRDLIIAREFGELIYVFPAGHLTQDPAELVRTARERLVDFRGCDYLLLSGDIAAIAISSAIAAQMLVEDERTLRYLIWDNRQRRYFPLNADVWEPAAETVG